MDELRQWWPVISLVLTSMIGWLLWSMKQSFATRQDIAELKAQFDRDLGDVKGKIGTVAGRVDIVERDIGHLPTMAALQETNIRLERLFGEIATTNANCRHIFDRQARIEETGIRHDQILAEVARATALEAAREAAREAAKGK